MTSSSVSSRLWARIVRTRDAAADRIRVRARTRHLSGPRRIELGADQVAVVCMLKNGAYHLDGLLEHHRALGAAAFLFIDNGSTDGTAERLAAEPDVTVVRNTLPVARYESLLRSRIARRLVGGGWFLFVDSDELIDMVHAQGRSIRDYAAYCNEHGFDAVVGQCLDLFSDRPLTETSRWSYARSIPAFDLYSLTAIDEFDYHDPRPEFSWYLRDNAVSNPDIKLKFGGIRRELFGENCALTNHRMIRNAPHVELYTHPHCSGNLSCADFTLLLRHYKFAGPFVAREREQKATGTWLHGEDAARMAIVGGGDFAFRAEAPLRFSGTADLVERGFLSCSERFLARFPPAGAAADPTRRA